MIADGRSGRNYGGEWGDVKRFVSPRPVPGARPKKLAVLSTPGAWLLRFPIGAPRSKTSESCAVLRASSRTSLRKNLWSPRRGRRANPAGPLHLPRQLISKKVGARITGRSALPVICHKRLNHPL